MRIFLANLFICVCFINFGQTVYLVEGNADSISTSNIVVIGHGNTSDQRLALETDVVVLLDKYNKKSNESLSYIPLNVELDSLNKDTLKQTLINQKFDAALIVTIEQVSFKGVKSKGNIQSGNASHNIDDVQFDYASINFSGSREMTKGVKSVIVSCRLVGENKVAFHFLCTIKKPKSLEKFRKKLMKELEKELLKLNLINK
jgi:hypothetical protein